MHIGSSMVVTASILLVVMIFVPIVVSGDDESTDLFARPRVFISIEELKKYLDDVKDYYNIHGKGRYGKRSGNTHNFLDSPKYPESSLRSILNALQPNYHLADTMSADIRSKKIRQRSVRPQVHELPNNN